MQITDGNAALSNVPQALSVGPTLGCHSKGKLTNLLSLYSSSATSESHEHQGPPEPRVSPG